MHKKGRYAVDGMSGHDENPDFVCGCEIESITKRTGCTAMGALLCFRYWQGNSVAEQIVQSPSAAEPPQALVEACRNGNCVLFAGGGFSVAAAFPTWRQFVTNLMMWGEAAAGISSRLMDSLWSAARAGDFDLVADGLVSELEGEGKLAALHEYIRRVFGKMPELTPRHLLLRRLPFSAALTTNFDTLLEQTFPDAAGRVFTPQDAGTLLDLAAKRQFFIAKLYGSLDHPETLLISPAQYRDAIAENRQFSQFMESVFLSRTLLFVGAGLDEIGALVGGVRSRGAGLQHFAMVGVSDEVWEAKAEMLRRRYGIQVIAFPANDESGPVDRFLESLVRQVTPSDVGAPAVVRPPRPPTSRLTRLTLQDIGPFSHLELELTPRWNILLGDNGVGKSTVLKALAVAMCGHEAQPYAGRLVRSGRSHGQITIETDKGRRYVTDIFKSGAGFEVESKPIRYLDAEGGLALGFPPIRAVTWTRPSGPQAEPERLRSTIGDLMPLVTGVQDARLVEIKQWMINLDYWRRKPALYSRHTTAFYERLQATLFGMMRRLAGSMKIEFQGIQADTWEVTVVTDDGPVPIEAVSQGTAALLGWTAVLLQRLYAMFDEAEKPQDEPAIVLIDEIDAHMHPTWQKSLVSDLGDLFPNVQFIATTHSPLVVGGMASEQVTRLARDEAGQVRRLDIPSDMLMGRADQILTGDLFGLSTTLDRKTLQLAEEYHTLLAKPDRNEAEERQVRHFRDQLNFRIPVSQETPAERRAYEFVRLLLWQQLGDEYGGVQEMLLKKAEQLIEAVRRKEAKP
jgi:hypothetical protein